MTLKKNFIYDKSFYLKALKLSLPMMIQSGITNFVSMLDNIMIGALGTEAMSGVSVANQLVIIFNSVMFGATAAGGIFVSQYFGARSENGIRNTFRIKTYVNLFITAITVILIVLFGDAAIAAYLKPDGTNGNVELSFAYGKEYMTIALIGLFPFAISQVFSSTLCEIEETKIPMYSGLVALVTNCGLNLVLIFGLLGFPAMGVRGAAIATVISRIVEMLFLIAITYLKRNKFTFIDGVFKTLKVPPQLLKNILIKGSPLILNELIWSLAIAIKNLCISKSGLEAVAAMNIQSTVFSVLSITYFSLASSIGIIVGGFLGAGKLQQARSASKKLLVFATLIGVVMGILQLAISPVFPLLYNTEDSVRSLATFMIAVSSAAAPLNAMAMSAMFTIRSGGRTLIVMLFDCVHSLFATALAACIFAYVIPVGVHTLFIIVTVAEGTKALLGAIMVSKVRWEKNITSIKSSVSL